MNRRLILLPFLFGLFAAAAFAAEEKVEEKEPPTASDLLVKAREAFREGKRDEALKMTTKALEIDPANVGGYVLRASMHDAMKQYAKAVADYTKVIELEPDAASVYQRRGIAHFKAGKIKESISDFDRFLKDNPNDEPHHWMRGISYYYSGEFDKGVKQFEVHKTVNPEDVENAVWHYLCKSRIDGVEKARAGLIEIKSDGRDWAMSVYEMFRGKMTPDEVLAKAAAAKGNEARLKDNLFYANLYVGLFYEAEGKADLAKKHIDIAAEKYLSEHYMGDVARIHAAILKKKAPAKAD
jgi:lipoprotein NlpI